MKEFSVLIDGRPCRLRIYEPTSTGRYGYTVLEEGDTKAKEAKVSLPKAVSERLQRVATLLGVPIADLPDDICNHLGHSNAVFLEADGSGLMDNTDAGGESTRPTRETAGVPAARFADSEHSAKLSEYDESQRGVRHRKLHLDEPC